MSAYGQQQPGPYSPPPAAPAVPALPQQLHIAGLVGGALAALGSLVAWASVEIQGESESVKGHEVDGLWTLLLSLAVIGLFGAGMATKKTVLSAAAAAPAVLVLIFAALNFLDPERSVRAKLEDEGAPSEQLDALVEQFEISAGFGLYLVLIGALGAIVAGAIAATKLKK
ncbi:hypothetical protein [Streptomyces sedi]|uniref:Uncharacterized protein n=1 Tax=Streptomyces sedi TaxID=555059 RepID=A0A5C4UT41_9ACTN|nr:hypothetical protein [Streptomyces sedi]TNM26473.1 hypothetical protein FH715_23620 [Streptomyces sedi]